ncbi:MAG TPA: ABC transporter substrate-binding protein [Vineibacter sp.]|nr:ABC transporter substrate-binding protein [Vineibacter sp.]
MKRRKFAVAAGGAILAASAAATAQPAERVRRIGVLSPQSAASAEPVVDALRQGLRDLGWQDGRNIAFVARYSDGAMERLPLLATDLVTQNVDVIVAGSIPGSLAAKQATRTIPVVMVTTGDPVVSGLVATLARPGGNVTGVTTEGQDLIGKRLELLLEIVPGIRRVAALVNPDNPITSRLSAAVTAAARAAKIDLVIVAARQAGDLEPAFAAMRGADVQALLIGEDPVLITERGKVVGLAARHRLPTVHYDRSFTAAGGLMFYGADLAGMYRHATRHIDKILRGANPAELPVEQPTRFELVVNLAAAKALGITIPQAMLLRADEVIE